MSCRPGSDKCLAPLARPAKSKKSSAPLFHAFTKRVRRELYEAYAWFVAAFRDAAEKLKAGDRTASFPTGSFPPHLPFVRDLPPDLATGAWKKRLAPVLAPVLAPRATPDGESSPEGMEHGQAGFVGTLIRDLSQRGWHQFGHQFGTGYPAARSRRR